MVTTLLVLVVSATIVYVITRLVKSMHNRSGLTSVSLVRGTIPMHFSIDTTLAKEIPILAEALQAAIDFLNDSMGTVVFAALNDTTTATKQIVRVLPMVLKPEDISLCFEGSLAFASCTNQSVLYVDSFAIKSIDMEVIQYGLMHALGHLLGLAHDDITDNFMYPKFHAKEPTVSERDVEFLKLVYGLKAEGNTRA